MSLVWTLRKDVDWASFLDTAKELLTPTKQERRDHERFHPTHDLEEAMRARLEDMTQLIKASLRSDDAVIHLHLCVTRDEWTVRWALVELRTSQVVVDALTELARKGAICVFGTARSCRTQIDEGSEEKFDRDDSLPLEFEDARLKDFVSVLLHQKLNDPEWAHGLGVSSLMEIKNSAIVPIHYAC